MSDDLRPVNEPEPTEHASDHEQGLIRIRGARQHNLKNHDAFVMKR